MDDNLKYYRLLAEAPQEALKTIQAGRLKGMSDINPMWRIKVMTETFGPCGFGWKYEITRQWQETYGQEVKTFVNINLYVRIDGEWSEPIPGTGGSATVAAEKSGLYVSDECYKMALTDALSVAMKALGVAANVYSGKNATYDTKYSQQEYIAQQQPVQQKQQKQAAATQQTVPIFTDENTVRQYLAGAKDEKQMVSIGNNTDPQLRESLKPEFAEKKNKSTKVNKCHRNHEIRKKYPRHQNQEMLRLMHQQTTERQQLHRRPRVPRRGRARKSRLPLRRMAHES